MNALHLCGVGVLGPGLAGWPATRAVLAGEQAYRHEVPPDPKPELLPPNERRRGPKTVRWTVTVAQEALQGTGVEARDTATVFASSSGEGETLHVVCQALASPGREVSPTRFHNSVHNAAGGYWSIACGSHANSVTLAAYDASFAAGLLESAALLHGGESAVLFVCYDLPYPEPLLAVRPIRAPLAVALLFTREARPGTLAHWRLQRSPGPATIGTMPGLPDELFSNPASQALPLLALVARRTAGNAAVQFADGRGLAVDSQP